mgnify:CR=1 FL=1
MKKIWLGALMLFGLSRLYAVEVESKWGVIRTSHTQGATGVAPILFTSATIRFEGINVSSPTPGSAFVLFRSTTGPAFKFDIATWTIVNTDYPANLPFPGVNLYGIESDSFTYVMHSGGSELTIFFRCKDSVFEPYNSASGTGYNGLCPGLPWSGVRGKPLGRP